ncbi:MAG: hypothetical protein O7G30_03685 [Proteobacteria bacterium]|nr:hypothetical protein [Pseudomonadota bacterium]
MDIGYTAIRVASIAVVAGLVAATPEPGAWTAVVWSISFGHYGIGLWYSRTQVLAAGRLPGGLLRFALLGVAGGTLYWSDWPLTYYFGIHHALNESYMLDRVTRAASSRQVRSLRAAGLVLHLVLYAALLRHRSPFAMLDAAWLLGALALSYTLFAVMLARARDVMSRRELFDNASLEVVGLGLLAASTVVDFNVLQIACYHFIFWILYPIRAQGRAGGRALLGYLALTLGVTSVFVAFSPLAIFETHFAKATYKELFVGLSFLHITLSFAVSSANPGWIRKRFTA